MPLQTGRLQRGLTLIEVLITLVVLAIGLLGLAGLQTSSLKNNQSAHYRSQAVMLTDDIFDRMRANRQAALNGEYDIALGQGPPSNGDQVSRDLQQWRDRVTNALPGGDSAVETDTSAEEVTVTLQWNDQRLESEDAVSEIELVSKL